MPHLFTTDFARASFFLLFVPPFSIAVPSPHIKGANPAPCLLRGTVRTHQEARRRGRARSGASPCIRFLVEIDGFVRSVNARKRKIKSVYGVRFSSRSPVLSCCPPGSPRLRSAAPVPIRDDRQRRTPALNLLYTRWQTERKVKKGSIPAAPMTVSRPCRFRQICRKSARVPPRSAG